MTKFRSVSFAAATALLACVGTPAMAASAISNAGFESGSLSPWYQSRDFGGPANWAITSSDSHSGTFSAFATGNKEIRQDFAGVATSDITAFSFWIKHPNAAVNYAAYDLFYSDNTSNQFLVATTGTGWQNFNILSNLAVGKTLTGFGLYGNSAGTTYLDDVTITTVTAAVPEPATWALMILGMGAVGFAMRRRKNASTNVTVRFA